MIHLNGKCNMLGHIKSHKQQYEMPCPKIGETGTSIYGVSDWAKTTFDYTVNWVLTIQ